VSIFTGLFKSRYPTKGRRDWVRLLSPEDRQVFVRMGMEAWEYGRLGGQARARSTKRDNRGRFAPDTFREVGDG
jgi:hypothetical protein